MWPVQLIHALGVAPEDDGDGPLTIVHLLWERIDPVLPVDVHGFAVANDAVIRMRHINAHRVLISLMSGMKERQLTVLTEIHCNCNVVFVFASFVRFSGKSADFY